MVIAVRTVAGEIVHCVEDHIVCVAIPSALTGADCKIYLNGAVGLTVSHSEAERVVGILNQANP
jgi:hypothetical protein